jgi:hypothetical protein
MLKTFDWFIIPPQRCYAIKSGTHTFDEIKDKFCEIACDGIFETSFPAINDIRKQNKNSLTQLFLDWSQGNDYEFDCRLYVFVENRKPQEFTIADFKIELDKLLNNRLNTLCKI